MDLSLIRRALKRHLTIIFVPHTSACPVRTTFSLSFLMFVVLLWTGLTVWSTYIATRHFDYWRLKVDREVTRFKLVFFANELKKSQELLAQVKEKDQQLRDLLEMKTKKSIITRDSQGVGGPAPQDQKYLQKLLEKKIHELEVSDLNYQVTTLRSLCREQLESTEEINNFISYQRATYSAMPNTRPCDGATTSPYGFRVHPLTGNYEFHTGLDIGNVKGTSVMVTADGIIKHCGWAQGYGKMIIVDHGYGFQTYYAHLSKMLITKGQKVKRGQAIGLMGETGTTTGVHLHYEVWRRGKTTNPARFMDKDLFFKVKM
ncbi:MAG: M23 family metallopeptidase [Elusimicrobia bacterium]|nr:M23 family metallopeptidase [Elusimicrobiota bacterium]